MTTEIYDAKRVMDAAFHVVKKITFAQMEIVRAPELSVLPARDKQVLEGLYAIARRMNTVLETETDPVEIRRQAAAGVAAAMYISGRD